jgi:hypothetical protein
MADGEAMNNKIEGIFSRTAWLAVLVLSLALVTAAGEQADFTGKWKLHSRESSGPGQKVAQIADDGRGADESVADQGVGARAMECRQIRDALGGTSVLPETLVITMSDADFTVGDEEGHSLALRLRGSAEKVGSVSGDLVIEVQRGEDAIVIMATGQSALVKTTYTMARGGYQMFVVIETSGPGLNGPAVMRYVYDYESSETNPGGVSQQARAGTPNR